jgi:hypothetical protein
MAERDDVSFLHGEDGAAAASPADGSHHPPLRPSGPLSDDFMRKLQYAIVSASTAIIITIIAVGLSSAHPSLALPALVSCAERAHGTNGSLADMGSYFDALARHASAAALPLNRNM